MKLTVTNMTTDLMATLANQGFAVNRESGEWQAERFERVVTSDGYSVTKVDDSPALLAKAQTIVNWYAAKKVVKLPNKPTDAFITALKTAGYGMSYETNSGNAEFHRLPTKDADGNDVYDDAPVNQSAIDAIVNAHIDSMPQLTRRQFNRFLAHTGLDDAIAARLAVLKPISRAQYADLKVWFNDPVCPIKYDTVYDKIQAIKADLPMQVPPLVLAANALKSAWDSAALISMGE